MEHTAKRRRTASPPKRKKADWDYSDVSGGYFSWLPREILACIVKLLETNADKLHLLRSCNWMNDFPWGAYHIEIWFVWRRSDFPRKITHPLWHKVTRYLNLDFAAFWSPDAIPASVATLSTIDSACIAPRFKLPNHITTLNFFSTLVVDLDGVLPDHLEKLIFGVQKCGLTLKASTIPRSVKNLRIYGGCHINSWDGVLPSTLTHLSLSIASGWHVAIELFKAALPPTLVWMKLVRFDERLDFQLPESLETLIIEGYRGHMINPMLPIRLKTLHVHGRDNFNISKPLPPTLIDLKLAIAIDGKIDDFLPLGLEKLVLGRPTNHAFLHIEHLTKLKTFVALAMFYFVMPHLLKLPGSVKTVKICGDPHTPLHMPALPNGCVVERGTHITY